jgi:hypothetical protein
MFEQRHISTVTYLNLHKLISCVLPNVRVIAGRDDTIPRLFNREYRHYSPAEITHLQGVELQARSY